VAASEKGLFGSATEKSSRPIATMITASIRKTTNVDASTASRVGRGRKRRRADALQDPDSRRTTSVIPSPAKQVAATP
jgi:uncharacterized protein (UPF0254 family)